MNAEYIFYHYYVLPNPKIVVIYSLHTGQRLGSFRFKQSPHKILWRRTKVIIKLR